MDTIYALASARGKSGVAVIRVSGPDAGLAGRQLAGDLPSPHKASVRVLRDQTGVVLDEALVIYFPKGQSFTGEASVEFQVHGSIAIVNAVFAALAECPGCRPAEAGEFTRRALENDSLDLARVEGLADLIEAETEAQRRQALRVFSGELGEKVADWRDQLIHAASLIEVTIDFADEDVPVDVSPEVERILSALQSDLQRQADGSRHAERVRDGFEVAIIGPPNIGKSTLLNYLAGRDAAITSDIAGTTRDVIEVRIDLSGLPVTFLDTAGLREAEDRIETIGIERTLSRAESADLRVILVDEDGVTPDIALSEDDIIVAGKADLDKNGPGVSGLTGLGVKSLIDRISAVLEKRASGIGVATLERHRIAILGAIGNIDLALKQLTFGPDRYEFVAEELRQATADLDTLVGKVDVEHILDSVFSRFCIGK